MEAQRPLEIAAHFEVFVTALLAESVARKAAHVGEGRLLKCVPLSRDIFEVVAELRPKKPGPRDEWTFILLHNLLARA